LPPLQFRTADVAVGTRAHGNEFERAGYKKGVRSVSRNALQHERIAKLGVVA
jgi:hypothetical protein